MPTKEELDAHFNTFTENEMAFLKENYYVTDVRTTENFIRQDGECRINLPLILASYKVWLIDRHIIEEIH